MCALWPMFLTCLSVLSHVCSTFLGNTDFVNLVYVSPFLVQVIFTCVLPIPFATHILKLSLFIWPVLFLMPHVTHHLDMRFPFISLCIQLNIIFCCMVISHKIYLPHFVWYIIMIYCLKYFNTISFWNTLKMISYETISDVLLYC